ncbi:MAG: DUF1566 domain-containing protein, partial [Proteobacteria bacterium]|nr:DUF1566 domain-containing protein [Pseudomonadota bacterium]
IIHRDIKPYNLMLTNDDRVKIIDFGLSRVRGEEMAAVSGMQVGSPFYAAPEQERDPQRADGRADLFSLGIMGLRMLTGRLFDHRQGPAVPASAMNPEVGPLWDAWIRQSIAGRPEDRFQTAQEMRLALQALPLNEKNVPCGWQQAPAPVRRVERREPERVMLKDIRADLGLDELFRPLVYATQDFAAVGPLVAHERNSGLLWQRYGAGFPLDWQQAGEYVAQLNCSRWQGRDTWRLPTVAEAFTILKQPLHGVACSTWPLFDSTIHWLWTCDPCNKRQAWMVDVVESFFDRLDKDGVASVCAVSSAA